MRTVQGVMEARERNSANSDSAKPKMIGTMRVTVTTRMQMTNAERTDMVTSRSTEHLWHASVTRHKVDQISSLRQCKYVVRWQKKSVSDMERVKSIGRYLVKKPRAECLFHWQQSGELEAYSDADSGGVKSTRRSVSAEVIMRGGRCLMEWTKKQQLVSLSTAEIELYAAVKSASEGLDSRVWQMTSVLCFLTTQRRCEPQRTGQSETRWYAEFVDTSGFQVRKVRHEEK